MKNSTIFQFFHWYFTPEGKLWLHAGDQAARLKSLGVTYVWLPPAYKSSKGVNDPGYAAYDLYDLGEFDQKGGIRTRYGTKEEYLGCINTLHQQGLQVMADIVLNHKFGADEQEKIPVQKVKWDNRNELEGTKQEKEMWTKYYFPGRNGKYSNYVWDWHSFTGLSEDGRDIYRILNEYATNGWEKMLDGELGNYDYLMGSDIEFRNPYVCDELKRWGIWYVETTGVEAFRLDAVKHIHYSFFNEWIDYLKDHFQRDFFFIGEYWRQNADILLKYIDATQGRIQLFDVPLHFNFQVASEQKEKYDLRKILDNSLLSHKPESTITFVDNHDTQPLQSLQSSIDYWFQPLAYTIILLREQGIPCVFYPHMYEAKYWDRVENGDIYVEMKTIPGLENMMKVRNFFAYGQQRDFFDHPNTIGWTREGIDERAFSGCAVLISNSAGGSKWMEIGVRQAGKTFIDVCGGRTERVIINEKGWGEFSVNDRFLSVWIDQDGVPTIN